jgi:PAS domain S-box-containing protein
MSSDASQGMGLSADARALAAILRSAVSAIVTIDSRAIIQTVNPAVERLFGFDGSELIGKNIKVLMPDGYRREHDGYMSNYLKSGHAKIIGIGREVTGLRKDGSTFPMHLSVGEFEVGGQRFFTGIMHDIGAQRRAEAQLSHQEALFRSIFESLPDPIIIADPSGTIRLSNPAFSRVFGYGSEDAVGLDTRALYEDAEQCDRYAREAADCPAAFDPRPRVVQFLRKSGQAFPGETVRAVIRDKTGASLGLLIVARDVTEKLSQEAVLRQALKMEAIGQLTGGIAHDFNNLLTVILGNVELLEPLLAEPLPQSLAREAREAAEMGARLTDRLLTFSRRRRMERKTLNLNEVVLGMFELLRRTLGEAIDVSTALKADLWMTEADPVAVENAILNLAINGRDAMPQGGRIVIETRNAILDEEAVSIIPGLVAGDYVQLSVSDCGEGMSEDVRERAFEPFFTTKGPGKGSGLGLATIYGFAKQSGGHATIYSEVGKGTTVNIYLPRAAVEEQQAEIEAAEPPPGRARGERILVVEDDERVRRLTRSRLESLGYTVIEASNGRDALALLTSGRTVDMVFSDLVMPGGISGLDLCRRIRAEWPGIRLLLTSGYSAELLDGDEVRELSLRILRKPYRQTDLARIFRDVLEGPV